MESVVKNCGAPVHGEIATAQFMEEMRELVKQSNDEKVKGKVLELVQTWGTAFKGSQKYSIVTVRLHRRFGAFDVIASQTRIYPSYMLYIVPAFRHALLNSDS